jgi:small subunit ribosomal protein S1
MAGSSECDGRVRRRLRIGQQVEGIVVQVGAESVFLDVGTAADARLDRTALDDAQGPVRLRVGDRISARVIDARPDAPVLAVSLGKGSSLSTQDLRLAHESRTPVEGTVARAVKGGVEVTLGGQRAFCPASQIDSAWVESVDAYVGQTLTFRVLEVKDEGRSVVVSRRALLEDQRREREEALGAELSVGADVEAVVSTIGRHGISLDLGGIEGFAHVSELAPYRVQNVEDVARPGDKVRARVLSVERTDRGLRVKLSLKQAAQAQLKPPAPDEILTATVVGSNSGGLIVTTPRGEGFLPVRELELPPGGDHRRAHPTGTTLPVVTTGVAAGGRLRLSARQVAEVVERSNYAEYTASTSDSTGEPSQFGSLGDILRHKLGLNDTEPAREAPAPPRAARAPTEDTRRPTGASVPREAAARPAGRPAGGPGHHEWPAGIVRRSRKPSHRG